MLNATADKINLSNVPKFQAKLQGMIDSCDHIMSLNTSDSDKMEAIATLLNGVGGKV